ncbi:MFS transporter [Dyadobacter sp. LJ53]|uniref:MFS transporter n=1 Tax=Dyadobacter chenwenxiniae TaxID=2906456 RepID=UPI001F3572B0|nr:MFS transporter [Dyadobacter chenwenxiniae]MCF0049309.1 MFS transporter [Dyadobacter chenwenxiniae]
MINKQSFKMTPAMTLLFAICCGLAVSNLYWAQPILSELAKEFNVPLGTTSALVTITQLGYGLGALLLIPLGDTLDRRRLIPITILLNACALLTSALAPSFTVLAITFFFVGIGSISAQILIPFAGDLAKDDEHGKIIGSIVSGVLIGILISRTVSGIVTSAFGWRYIYFGSAAASAAIAFYLSKVLPTEKYKATTPYLKLIGSIFTAIKASRAVQITLVLSMCNFAVFTMFWTGITFLLSADPFNYSASEIGLVGLVGLSGAFAAKGAGRLHDSGFSTIATGVAFLVSLFATAICFQATGSIVILLIAVFLLDIAVQCINVLNQSRLYAIAPDSRSRLSTSFVCSNFAAGALGSFLAGYLWRYGGWQLIAIGQALLTVMAIVIWLLGRQVLKVSFKS